MSDSPQITKDGLIIQSPDDVFEQLSEGYMGIYGADINLSLDAPDGQKVGLEAGLCIDMQTLLLSLASSLDPEKAGGAWQDALCKISGLFRAPATQSFVDVVISANADVTLSDEYSVQDSKGQVWKTREDTFLVAGDNNVTLVAEKFGSISALANTVNKPLTILSAVDSVNNPLSSVDGVKAESDDDLRRRRNASVETPAFSTLGGMQGRLLQLLGVVDAKVYENQTKNDSDGIPANAIWAVVDGGVVQEIAKVIAVERTAGCGMRGTISSTYVETIHNRNGTAFQVEHKVSFDRPTKVPLSIQGTVYKKANGGKVDLDRIKQTLATKTYRIDESAIASELYCLMYAAGDNFIATSLQISRDGKTFTDKILDTAMGEKFVVDASNINIEEV